MATQQMGTGELANSALLYLDPEEIKIDEITNVRLGPPAADDAKKIDELAQSILLEGQLQPVLVRSDGNGFYNLIDGRRRLAAIRRLKHDAVEGEEPIIKSVAAVIVDKSDEDSYRAALMANLKRKQMSPIDLAHNIQVLRIRNDWEGKPGTKHVAEYLGVSPATITTHEKLLTMPPQVQDKAHSGFWSAEAALEFATNVEPTKAEEVAARAEELAEEEEKAKTTQKRGRTKQGVSTSAADSTDVASNALSGKDEDSGKKTTRAKVSRKHIEQAAKEKGAQKAIKAPGKLAILQFFESVGSGSDYPLPMTAFADALTGPYAEGKLSDKQLLNRWDAIAAVIPAKHAAKSAKSKQAKGEDNPAKTSAKKAGHKAGK